MKRIVLGVITAIFSLSSVLTLPSSAFATDGQYNEAFYTSQNIGIYDPNDTGCGTPASSLTSLTGADNEQKIYNYWTTAGYSPAQAAGITGSLQAESGFSPFRQETTQKWPAGGYGIAQFTSDRLGVTQAISTAVGASTFNQYYTATYGGAVALSTGFIPAGVPEAVNDAFLLAELNYLNSFIQGLTPNPTYAIRSTYMTTDFPNLSIASGQKLSTYLQSLTDAGSVAEAWTYLYESPQRSLEKTTATQRAANATTILTQYSSGTPEVAGCSSIGVGGLTYAQAVQFDTDYFKNKNPQFLKGTVDAQGAIYGNQCTAFSDYVNAIINAAYNSPDGQLVVGLLLSRWPNAYKSLTDSSVEPFTTYSWTYNGVGHTGVVLGIEADGSVVIGEQNVSMKSIPSTLIEHNFLGTKNVGVTSTMYTEHWAALSDYVNYIRTSWHYTGPSYAGPKDEAGALEKIQKVING